MKKWVETRPSPRPHLSCLGGVGLSHSKAWDDGVTAEVMARTAGREGRAGISVLAWLSHSR